MTQPPMIQAPEPVLNTPAILPEGFTLKFKRDYFDAVPHLFDKGYKQGQVLSEVQVVAVEPGYEPKDGHFLSKGDGVKYYFTHDSGSDTNFAIFKQHLQQRCQRDPILCDGNGYVLDGFATWFGLLKLGIPPKVEIVDNFASEADKLTWIRNRKLARQHLTEKQRMRIVKDEIKAHPERTNQWTAELLGISRNTVTKYRRSLELDGAMPKVEKMIGKDGSEHAHKPYETLTEEEKENDKKKEKERDNQRLVRKVQQELGYSFLNPDSAGTSLANIEKFVLSNTNIKPKQLETLRAALDKIAPVTTPTSATATATGTATATAISEVKVHEVKKTKKGVSIDIDPKQMPDNVDVVAQVKAGPVSFGGMVINFGEHALLLMPHIAQDATLTSDPPREDDLLADRDTGDPSSSVG